MLSRFHRLPSSQINGVMRRGKRIAGETIQIIMRKSEADVRRTSGGPRFAIVVSTKIDKRATRRNRMKRLLSESIRHLLPRLHSPVDCIVVVRKDFSRKLQTETEPMVTDIFQKAGLLNEE